MSGRAMSGRAMSARSMSGRAMSARGAAGLGLAAGAASPMAGLAAGATLLAVGLAGCRAAAPAPEARQPETARQSAPPPTEVERRHLRLELSPLAEALPLGALPPFPRFRDPFPLPSRKLRYERNLAWKSHGPKRQLVVTHLAARLWKMANENIDRVRSLEERARRTGEAAPAARIAALRREASAHLQECVTLLEGVLETPSPPRMARVRLAHYLRELKPASAIPLLRSLLAEEPAGPRRQGYGLDLAQLLVAMGEAREAAAVLAKLAGAAATPRGRLLHALALAGARDPGRAAAIQAVLGDCAKGETPERRILDAALPRLLASLPQPAAALEALRATAPACFARGGAALGTGLARRLLDEGRPGAAVKVRDALGRLGVPLPERLGHRVRRVAGPFPAEASPPPTARFATLLALRLRGVLRCAGRPQGRGLAGIAIRIGPDGRARLLPRWPPPNPIPRPEARPEARRDGRPAPRGSAGAPRGSAGAPGKMEASEGRGAAEARLWRCLEAAVPTWRLPGWRAPKALELVLDLAISASAPPRSPPTDRD